MKAVRPAGATAASAPAWLRRLVVPRANVALQRRLRLIRDRRVPLTALVDQHFPLPPRVRGAALDLRAARLSDPSLTVVRRQAFEQLIALPLTDADLGLVTAANLALVVDILDRESIEYFVVDNRQTTRTAVAVDEADRARLLDAFRREWADRAVYLSLARVQAETFERPALAGRALSWPGVEAAEVLRIFQAYTAGRLVCGPELGCDLEFWPVDVTTKMRIAPRENRVAPAVPIDAPEVPLVIEGRTYRTIEPFTVTTAIERDFPIDVVYTWVDGSDPEWAARRDHYLGRTTKGSLNEQATNASRYLSRDELRYSLRSIYMFAPWVNHIYLVTDDQTPPWLDPSSDRVSVVPHREIFRDPSVLPAFNSHAIESQLHHIDGLSEHYLYFNDDMLLGRPVPPHRFFHENGLAKMFVSTARIEYGPPSVADMPVMAAAKNIRELLLRDFGRYVTQKQKHAPYPHLRSVMEELEERYPEEFTRTAASRFRHPSDVSIASSLQQNYSFLTHRAVPAGIAYSYFDLSDRGTPSRLERLQILRDLDSFCCNDTDAADHELEGQLAMTQRFFEGYFPLPAPWEIR